MILAFLQYGNRGSDVDCARLMLQSKAHVMPHLKSLHMRTPETKNMGNRSQVAAYEADDFYGTYAARHFAAMHDTGDDEIIVSDVDVIYRADVRDLFLHKFDVAMVAREGGPTKYIGGFILSRCAAFWRDVADVVNCMPGPLRQWAGIQLALETVAKNYAVLDLDEQIYNRAPLADVDPCDGAKVVHYRGERKKWMLQSGLDITATVS